MIDKKIREAELEQYRQIWLTKRSYDILREQKRKQKKSMAKILDELVYGKYGI